MIISTEEYAELLIERVYDILWHNEVLVEGVKLNLLKDLLRKDIIHQLYSYRNEQE